MIQRQIDETIKFADDFLIPKTSKNLHDIFCGLHSGFPKCCILYFITSWKPFSNKVLNIISNDYFDESYLLNLIKTLKDKDDVKLLESYHYLFFKMNFDINYIRCHNCAITNNKIIPKNCDCLNQKINWQKYLSSKEIEEICSNNKKL